MRVSDISKWLSCERMALSHNQEWDKGKESAAAYVGTLTHRILSGEAITDAEIQSVSDQTIAWDATTPTQRDAVLQARRMAYAADTLLEKQGFYVVATEHRVANGQVIGHFDLQVYSADHGNGILDLKTGRTLGQGWIQLGGYLDLCSHATWEDELVNFEYGGILHVPRTKKEKPVPTLEIRPSEGLKAVWTQRKGRINDIIDGAMPLVTPGFHCSRCALECAVRSDDFNP